MQWNRVVEEFHSLIDVDRVVCCESIALLFRGLWNRGDELGQVFRWF